ncbi:MAG: enoyl-[acyl-carrier-protein] reductase FabK [Chloroflexi bacterium]|nr:enoyl-[acyl-carrier-protein] reductase FabK [Chloroflexota bacterium]
MIRTPLCDLLGIEYPIVQGGMAWVGTAELAAAISNAGGLGVIGGGNAPAKEVAEEIRLAKELTDKPFGLNIPLAISEHADDIIALCIEERVKIVVIGAWRPGDHIARLKEAGIVVMPVVASVALAKRLERQGVDALVAEGMESGGHIGDVATMPLVPQVVDAVDVPVVAAGGFADGRGLVAALALGAQGIQMGTRFICTTECTVHENYKQAIIKAKDRSTMTTGHSLGHPVRALRNPMVHQFEELERRGVTEQEIIEFGTGKLRLAAIEGDVVNGSVMAGQIAGMVNDIVPVEDLIERIVAEAEEIIGGLQGVVS